ncbi:MAG TPA: OsmC family protein [Candidatus Limnocylindrales bacterium]
MGYEVETITVDGRVTALGSAGPHSLVIDRAVELGGGGLGFNGGQLLNLAVAACISNDLFREATRLGLPRRRVRVTARSDYGGSPAVSGPIDYDVEVDGDAPAEQLDELVRLVDSIGEIPNSVRRGTEVRLGQRTVNGSPHRERAN